MTPTRRPTRGPTDIPGFLCQPAGDIIYDPALQGRTSGSWLPSQPLAGKTASQWLDLVAGLSGAGECDTPIEPVTIDGNQGRLVCGGMAATSAGDRGYLIWIYTGGTDPAAVAGYDQAYFNDVLATLQLPAGRRGRHRAVSVTLIANSDQMKPGADGAGLLSTPALLFRTERHQGVTRDSQSPDRCDAADSSINALANAA